jgi:hypothetical protein
MDACNYNPDANWDSCIYAEENYNCDGDCIVDIDCNDECGGSSEVDACGVCGGDNDCYDCAETPNGGALEDNCGTCDNDPNNDCIQDCADTWGGLATYDNCGVCSGDNNCYDCAETPNGDALVDNCGTCDSDPENDCVVDCAGDWGGTSVEDACGVCGGDAESCFIELSIGSVADGVMEIIMNNTIPVLGFQFNVTGADLSGASGGSAADAGFQVSTGVDGMVLGFSMLGAEIPQGNGVLTNVAYTATFNEACITNDILALGEWSGGFYEINIGGCAALDYGVETTTLDVTYSSDTDIYGFQFDVSGAELVNASGGDAETTFDQISFSSETGMVLGLSFIGASIPAGSGILLELEVVGDGTCV